MTTIIDMSTVTPDPLLDEIAAGRYMGGEEEPLSARTLQRWRAEGKGPAHLKIGHLVRYRRSALDAYLASCERRPTEAA